MCSGIGRRCAIDPLVIRIAFGLLIFTTWTGLLIYGAAALLMGDEQGDPSIAERVFHRRLDDAAVVGALVVLFLFGMITGFAGSSIAGGPGRDSVTALALLALAILVAQARGVNLVEAAKNLPDRLKGTPLEPEPQVAAAPVVTDVQEWIDLATLQPIEVVVPVAVPRPPKPPRAPERRRKHRSPLGKVFFLLACTVAAAMAPVAADNGDAAAQVQIICASALAVVGLGLLVGAWFGRPHGLVPLGALLSITLMLSAGAGALPADGRYGEVKWQPTDPTTTQPYRIVAGEGTLDLRALPLQPGQSYEVNAEIGLGGLRVILPTNAKVKVKASVFLGDITVNKKVISGPRARYEETVVGTAAADAPTIELTVKGRFGDLELTHAA
ncbi:hypothetical protein GCM10027589_43840 [Actinocorallia lasiicapitis]